MVQELCNVPVVRHHCDRCRMVVFFERRVDGYFYCERCEDEDEMVSPERCCSPYCKGAVIILKWNKFACMFHCPQCDTLRHDILRTAPDFSSYSRRGYIRKFISYEGPHPVIKTEPVGPLTLEDMWPKKRLFMGDNLPLPLAPYDDTQIRTSVPTTTTTTRHLIDHGAKTVLAGHLERPKGFISEYSLKSHVPDGELNPPFQATKSDSGLRPSKPDQGPDEQLTPVRTMQYKRHHR